MKINENYSFEAEMADGTVITEGGNLTNCVRFTLIPKNNTNIPKHVFSGVKMKRRFCRSFNRYSMVSQRTLPGLLTWRNGDSVIISTEDLSTIVETGDSIAKNATNQQWWTVKAITGNLIELTQVYLGKTQQIGGKMLLKPKLPEYLHCVVCEGFRLYIKSSNGEVIVTQENYELYL